MSQLTKVFEDQEIRIVRRDGALWFVAVDICKALNISNTTMAMKRLHDDETTLITIEGAHRQREVNAVSEPGLYALIMRSSKPAAERFDRWVRHDVLPELRKTGSYHMGDGAPVEQRGDMLKVAETLLGALKEARTERHEIQRHQEHTEYEVQQLEERVEQLEAAKQAPGTVRTRYGHEVAHHTWDGMRETIRVRVTAAQDRTGNAWNAVWRYLYDSVERKYGFHAIRLHKRRGGSSAIKSLDFHEMRAVYEVSKWLFS